MDCHKDDMKILKPEIIVWVKGMLLTIVAVNK